MRALAIYSFIVAIICLLTLRLSVFYVTPRVLEWVSTIDMVDPLPAEVFWAVNIKLRGYNLIRAGIILGIVGLASSCYTPLWRRFRRIHLPVIGTALSGCTLIFICWHFFSVYCVAHGAVLSKQTEVKAYRLILEKASMLEGADRAIALSKQRFKEQNEIFDKQYEILLSK